MSAARRLKVLKRAAALLPDSRQAGKVQHSMESMLRQRVFALAQGYEDLNDHEQLRHDPLLQAAAQRASTLASAPTLCRMENYNTQARIWYPLGRPAGRVAGSLVGIQELW